MKRSTLPPAPFSIAVPLAICASVTGDVVFDLSGAESAHEIDGGIPNEMRVFEVAETGIVAAGGLGWDLGLGTTSFGDETSFGSEARIRITSPTGTVATLAGDTDFGWPDAGGVFFAEGAIDAFAGEPVTGTWEVLFYEAHDNFLNAADGFYTTPSVLSLTVVEQTPGDLDGDGSVGTADLLQLLAAWGFCGNCIEDLDGDGAVGTSDLLLLLSNWS